MDMEEAWKIYEHKRIKFRELSGLTSIGGGTGMLNRIQTAFRHQSTEKLKFTLKRERESFFSTLPDKSELEKNLEQLSKDLQNLELQLLNIDKFLGDIDVKRQEHILAIEQKKNLVDKINLLSSKIKEVDEKITLYQTTKKFLQTTLERVNKKFVPGFAKIISEILSKLTGGRYKSVHINEDLDIRIFSSTKNDFMAIDELSGGTVNQLLLSLRLACSQAVMASRMGIQSQQFLLFDEPIISLDEERIEAFFDFFGEGSENFVQLFFISPRKLVTENLDMVIQTDIDSNKLVVEFPPNRSKLETKRRIENKNKKQTGRLVEQEGE